MEKIQFKRASTISTIGVPEAGEIRVLIGNGASNQGIVVGTGSAREPYFRIRPKPYRELDVVGNVTISGEGTTQYLNVTKIDIDGNTIEEEPIPFTISGTIDKAKQLVNNSGTGYSVGSNTSNTCQPIFFTSGKPSAITQTRGASNTPIWMDGGVIKTISGNIGDTNKPVYIDSNGAIKPITQTTASKKLQYFSNGQIVTHNAKIGGAKRPIYYDGTNGFTAVNNFDDDGNYTGTTVNSKYINLDNLIQSTDTKPNITTNGTGVDLRKYVNNTGLYMIVIQYDNCYYTYIICYASTSCYSSTAYIAYGTSYIPTSILRQTDGKFYWKSHSGSLAGADGTIVQIKKIG